jgi:hypothetical protein
MFLHLVSCILVVIDVDPSGDEHGVDDHIRWDKICSGLASDVHGPDDPLPRPHEQPHGTLQVVAPARKGVFERGTNYKRLVQT